VFRVSDFELPSSFEFRISNFPAMTVFLYGDGLFEGVRIFNGKPFRWKQHMERFQRGANFLRIAVPFSAEAIEGFAVRLIAENQIPNSLLRLTLSRGVGPRGYSPKNAERPTLVMATYPMAAVEPTNPPAWQVFISSFRLPAGEPLARFKNLNKLPQVLARAEADVEGADEALLLNSDGYVVEGSTSNLFWIKNGTVCTPPLPSGILPGVTRAVVVELCGKVGLNVREENIGPAELRKMDGTFLSLSSSGIAEVAILNGEALKRSPVLVKLSEAYWNTVKSECA
jgi:branched-subunit amino acid aminotransferase/4-amino-4-deoxychorismate lyase